MPKILAALVLTLFAATLPELFKQAKDEFSAGNYQKSLADFETLDAESQKPGLEADRAKLAPIILFYRGANLAALGRKDEARAMFERVLKHRNALGLLSEDVEVASGELWGNFPQTYSMVGLINSAKRLSKSWDDAF